MPLLARGTTTEPRERPIGLDRDDRNVADAVVDSEAAPETKAIARRDARFPRTARLSSERAGILVGGEK